MTDTWQSGSIPPPPSTPPPGFAPAPPPTPAVNPFLGGAGPGRSRSVPRQAGRPGGVGRRGGRRRVVRVRPATDRPPPPPRQRLPPTLAPATTAPVAAPPRRWPRWPQPPTRDLDLGAAPKLAAVLPQLELFVEEARGHRFTKPLAVTPSGQQGVRRRADQGRRHEQARPGRRREPQGAAPAAARTSTPTPPGSYDDIGGFYDPKTKHLYVRSITLNPLAQSIIAHEMTHALDDEYFNLTKIERAGRNSDQDEAIHSLIEGDARAVENRFNAGADHPAQGARRTRSALPSSARPRPRPVAVPRPRSCSSCSRCSRTRSARASSTSWSTTAGRRGSTRRSAAPPTSTLQIIDPGTRFLHRVDARKVAEPAPAAGRVVDHDVAGALALSAVLAEAAPTEWLLQTSVEALGRRRATSRPSRAPAPACRTPSGPPAPRAGSGSGNALTRVVPPARRGRR